MSKAQKAPETEEVEAENEETTEESEAVEPEEASAETEESAEAPEPDIEPDPLALAEAKAAELGDRLLRQGAEFENIKKRMQAEVDSRLKFASINLLKELLPGLDNLERALDHAKEHTEENEALKNFADGVEMVKGQFFEALKAHSVERYAPLGETFDPNIHEAVGMVDSDEYEPDQIAVVLQAGYKVHDRVIRPAMVQVAKK